MAREILRTALRAAILQDEAARRGFHIRW